MSRLRKVLLPLASLKLTIACIASLIAVVLLCTLDQVQVGVYAAVKRDIRSVFICWTPAGSTLKLPFFPGGVLVGLALLVNLAAAFALRLAWDVRKIGSWLVHAGVLLLVLGEFAAGFFSVESRMTLREGQTLGYSEMPARAELAVIDGSPAGYDEVFSIDEDALARRREFRHPAWPFALRVKKFLRNAALEMRSGGEAPAASPPLTATEGIGAGLRAWEKQPVESDESENQPAVLVDVETGGGSLGTWLLSRALPDPQSFVVGGREYRMSLREKRRYQPFTLTLKKFTREMYPGSDIPKSFSSLVHLRDAAMGEDRDALISMNNPLRYGGKSFYQSSYGENDKLSVLQVVDNPGRLIPYAACLLAGIGLLIQFAAAFLRAQGPRA